MGADGNIRRYNFTNGGALDATAVPVANVTSVDYSGYDAAVTRESDGKIRRYNFYTGGNADITVTPVASVTSVYYAGFKGCVTLESDGKNPSIQLYYGSQPRRGCVHICLPHRPLPRRFQLPCHR